MGSVVVLGGGLLVLEVVVLGEEGRVVGLELLGDGLIRAGDQELRTGLSYDIVASTKRPLRQSAVLVKDWLLSEMRSMEALLCPVAQPKTA